MVLNIVIVDLIVVTLNSGTEAKVMWLFFED